MFDSLHVIENSPAKDKILSGKNIVNFDLHINEQKTCQDKLINDLPVAIDNNELELFYQPQINLNAGKTTSVEALLRWQHRYAGNIPPHIFIPLAEQYGHINRLTEWVLNNALHQLFLWRNCGVNIDMAVNLSVHNFDDLQLPDKISGLLSKWSIPARHLILEITEGVMIKDPAHVIKILKELRAIGVKLSLDDFGSGYSSLSHLSKLPINELKIDRALVTDIEKNRKNSKIVEATIALAKSLGLSVVAEGVESLIACSKLANFKCDTVQGFYFSKPVNQNEFSDWLIESDWGLNIETCYAI